MSEAAPQQSAASGAVSAIGALAGLAAAAGIAGKRAAKNRTSMKAVGVGINGFGRIGRQVARIAMKDPETELKLINASYDADYLAYMFKYDTIHGKYDGTIEVDGDSLVVDGKKIALSHTRDPADIPFAEHGAEYVCESTGVFLTTEKVQAHLKAGAKKVVFSAPAKDESHTIVMGVNEGTYKTDMDCVSCASCTTNGLAPAVRVLQEKWGIKRGLMTTCHAMTASQPTVDGTSKKDWRGGRAGPGNIIPSSTGAAKAVAKTVAVLALAGSAAAFSPSMSMGATRRQAMAGAAAGAVALPLAANAKGAKDSKAPVITIFDARGCADHKNVEYKGAKAGDMNDDQCVKVAMQAIKVGDDIAGLVLKECLSELKRK